MLELEAPVRRAREGEGGTVSGEGEGNGGTVSEAAVTGEPPAITVHDSEQSPLIRHSVGVRWS